MSCFGFSKRKTRRGTVPNGLEPASLGVPLYTRPQQQFETARAGVSGQHAFHYHVFPYHGVQLATSNFSNDNLVGEGGFGRVYKGQLADGTLVAVKRLDRHGLQGDLEFNVEVSIMAGLNHPNVVPLLGSCCEADQRVAVFDYMPHGNLRDLLDSKTPAARHFNWPARLNILLGVAQGLHYLHSAATPAIVHRDLKSSNILIDGGGQARICDFGLARHKSLPQCSSAVPHPADSVMMGTFGYMAPEYAASVFLKHQNASVLDCLPVLQQHQLPSVLTSVAAAVPKAGLEKLQPQWHAGQITDKSDMYAFGVVVLEIMTGMQAVDARRPQGCETLPHLLQPALQAVQLMQGNLDPALMRHAPLPAAQLAALCEVAASCLESRPYDRPTASCVVTYLQKLLKFTDSAVASAGCHARTDSSPPTGPSHPPTLGTPGNLLQHRSAGLSSGIYYQQEQQQQQHQQQQQRQQHQRQHQQRHRPAQSMPHLTCTPDLEEEDTADSAHSPLSRGHDLRSSAGYGNELGIPGPSRHLTPLAQGLRSASLCSLPNAATATAATVETSTAAAGMTYHGAMGPDAAAMMTPHRTFLDHHVTQEESSWTSSSAPAHSSPVAPNQTCFHGDSVAAVRQLSVGSGPPSDHHRGQACGLGGWASTGRDLRDSAWGCVATPLQPPSAPPLLRSSSAQVDDPRCPQPHTKGRGDGHRPTQSMLPAYHQTPLPQLHTSPSSQQDQSLHQLVQSRAAQNPVGPPFCLGCSPQRPHTLHECMSKPDEHQRPAIPKLTKRQSGNPFASDHSAEEGDAKLRQQGSSSLSRGVSGNPFAAMWEMNCESSRVASSQAQADSEHVAGCPPAMDSKVPGMACLGSEMVSHTAATAGNVQEHAQPSSQQAILRFGGSSVHSASSASALKNPEMSPLQNGLIRAWPSPCKVQPPEVTASSWHHFLSASSRPKAAGAACKEEAGTVHHASAPARVGVCLVCLDASRDWQMVPCGHAAACKSCAQQLQQHQLPCPVCRATVTGLCYRQFQQTFVGLAPRTSDCKQLRQQAF